MLKSTNSPKKLVVMTNPYELKFETDRINQMFREGLDELHIRKPKCDVATMKKFIKEIDSDFHHKIVLHSHYSLVNTFDIHMIHLPHTWASSTIKTLFLDHIVLKGKKVRKSMTIGGCKALYKPIKGIHELVLGPVFARASYMINNQQIETTDLEKALRHSKVPVTALGGVTSQTVEFLKSVGFAGIALQSGVWKTPDPVAAFVEIRDHYIATQQKLRIAV